MGGGVLCAGADKALEIVCMNGRILSSSTLLVSRGRGVHSGGVGEVPRCCPGGGVVPCPEGGGVVVSREWRPTAGVEG